ncbi:complex I intermediate-associated protein 30, mitochondrial [Tetranychus urticae]|uniref:NADH:ubiquinone oxidoreductase intermediate-associated protein 30 domain-containing protein n=1 Tax=Tetranychus urticae TaxID=32264 RepID=T1K581_TETUR|nr:complex I intermediate-associated protein 30, mitochondrial [Tetranychus urticae]
MFSIRLFNNLTSQRPIQLVRGLQTSYVNCALIQSPRGALKYEEKYGEFYEGDFKTRWKLLKEEWAAMKKFYSKWDNWDRFVFKRLFSHPMKKIKTIIPGDEYIFADLSKPESLNVWKLGSDRIWNEGYSTCRLEANNGGYATFSGYLDSTNLPKDGTISRVGYVNMTTYTAPEFLAWDNNFNFEDWSHITLKIRGDGRRWLLILGQRGYSNQCWDDKYVTWLPTHGGPYWQEVKIPFSKFFLGALGRIQEPQCRMDKYPITYIGLTLMDGRTGPFRLDVKSLGVAYDPRNYEEFAYEDYYVPEHPHHYLD